MFAQEYKDTVQAVTQAVAEIKKLAVVTESTGILKALQAGKPALLVHPPAIEFQTPHIWFPEYMLLLVAPRSRSNLAAATELAPVIEALAANLPGGIERVRPYDYTIGDEGYIVPAYEITYTGE